LGAAKHKLSSFGNSQEIGAKLLFKLPSRARISLIWTLWKGCAAMDKHSAHWRPLYSDWQYHVRETIGLEIEQRSRGDKSLVPGVIQKLEEKRLCMGCRSIDTFAIELSVMQSGEGRKVSD
jgi:hypothetical protein